MSSKNKLIINCAATHVSAAEFSVSSGRLVLDSFQMQELSYDYSKQEDWLKALVAALKTMKVSGHATLIAPSMLLLAKTIKIPHVEASRQAEVIAFEAEKNIPYPLNEVTWDYQIIADDGVETEIYLTSMKASVADEFCSAVSSVGVIPDAIEASSILDYNTWKYCGLENDVILLNIGARFTNMMIMRDDGLFVRSIPVGGNVLTQSIADSTGQGFPNAEELKRKFIHSDSIGSSPVAEHFTAGASSVLVSGLSIDVPEGATFTAENGLTYTAIMAKSTAVNDFETDCSGSGLSYTCSLTLTVPVQATAPGDNYNLSAESTWNSFSGASVSNPKAISGGTSNKVKVITQSDVDQARDQLVSDHAEEGKESLFSDLTEQNAVVIEPSYTSETTNTAATPAVGEEGDETTVSVTVKYAVYTVDEAKVESFIAEKMSLSDDQKLYSIGSPYFERFTNLEESARLKTVVAIGPVLTEDTILDRVKGVKIGEAQSILKSINGVSSVEIAPSYFWVRSVPNDPNKITINLQMEGETEDQQ